MNDSIRILIAEDNALLRGVLRDALAEAGMIVVAEASDGAEAVSLAEQSTPDVVVMDMRMPNVDGIEATEQIAHATWAMPVVVLSAYDEPQMIEAALAAGADQLPEEGRRPGRADRGDSRRGARRLSDRLRDRRPSRPTTSSRNSGPPPSTSSSGCQSTATQKLRLLELDPLHDAVRRVGRHDQSLADPVGSLVMTGVHIEAVAEHAVQPRAGLDPRRGGG